MDGTPYPPPAPEVPPASTPQPSYQPPVPQAPYQAPVPQGQYPAVQPPKKKTALIIGIVVGVLLLCCCGAGVAGYFAYQAAQEETTNTLDELTNELETVVPDLESDGTDGASAIDTGWEDFAPAAYDATVWIAPESFHEEVVAEAASILFPDFDVEEVLARLSTEYTTDTVLARASLPGDPKTQISFYLEVENTAAYDSGWTNDPATQEYDYLDWGQAANGREYFWDNEQLVPLFGGADSATTDLLVQVATDFPGCVIYLVESDGSTAYVEFTLWEAYPEYSEGYYADYSYDASSWALDSASPW